MRLKFLVRTVNFFIHGIGNPFYAEYQHIECGDRPYMGGQSVQLK